MVFPVAIFLLAGLILYSGLHDMTVTDSIRTLLGRAPGGKLGSLSGAPAPLGVTGATGATGDGTRQAVVTAAQSALGIDSGYAERRPYPPSLAACRTRPTDCSGFATLCYKQAGALDPNGLAYSGMGFTGTLELHGQKTDNPQPGDLHFWHSPDHVAIDVGGGNIVQWGGPPGPSHGSLLGEMAYHSSYVGARSYL